MSASGDVPDELFVELGTPARVRLGGLRLFIACALDFETVYKAA